MSTTNTQRDFRKVQLGVTVYVRKDSKDWKKHLRELRRELEDMLSWDYFGEITLLEVEDVKQKQIKDLCLTGQSAIDYFHL